MIAVYGLVVYIIIIQVIRLIQNISNRNVEDGKARAEAKENIKGAVFVIAATAIIGGFGFTALCFFMNQ
jgi:nitrate reductase NapE component